MPKNKMSDARVPAPYSWTFGRVVWGTLVLVAVGLGFWLIYRFHQVLFVFFIAVVIGTVLRPAVLWLSRHRVPPQAGIIFVYLLLLALLIGFGLLLFPLIIEQTSLIMTVLPDYYQSVREWGLDHANPSVVSLSLIFPVTWSLPTPEQTGQEMLNSAGQLLGYLSLSVNITFTAIIILLLAYYWTLNGPRTIQYWLMLLPQGRRESIGDLVTVMETKVSAYVAGQGILMLVVGGMALVAYWLIGLPYVLVLAFAAGLMEVVPLIGPVIGAIPAVIVAMSLGTDKVIWVIIATIAIQQLENSILVPRIMRKAVGVNPFVTLLALFAFGSLLGTAGALMAIPMAAIIQLLLDHFLFHPDDVEPATAGRDYTSRLRYEAQELSQDLRKQARLPKEGSEQTVQQTDQVMDEIEAIVTDFDHLLEQSLQGDGQ